MRMSVNEDSKAEGGKAHTRFSISDTDGFAVFRHWAKVPFLI